MASAEVEAAAAEVAGAVHSLSSPMLPAQERHRLYQLCEQVRESPLALQVGLHLSMEERPDIVRHVGLQMLEGTIKYNWNELPVDQKLLLKDSSLKLMAAVGDTSPAYMRDALCRPLVEIVKREWPQQYADFVPDMSQLAARGPLHTELVLRVFLRLAEDVATFQTLSAPGRRRDIYRALVDNMETLLSVMSATLTSCVAAGADSALAHTCLATLDCYLDWASVPLLMQNNGALVTLLIRLLSQPALREMAAGCLAVLLNRNGNANQREPLLVIFSAPVVSLLSEHVNQLCAESPSDPLLATLRLLAQALSGAVGQLCYCWGRDESKGTQKSGAKSEDAPAGWAGFVALLLRLTQVPAVSVAVVLMPAWVQLLRHKLAARSAPLLGVALPLLEVLQRRACPLWAQPADADVWRQVDMDSSEELKMLLSGCLRPLATVAPEPVFCHVAAEVSNVVRCPLPSDTGGVLDKHAPQRAQWEVAVWLGSQVASVITDDRNNTNSTSTPAIQNAGQALLTTCLERKTLDPSIFSHLVSLLSNLAGFLPQQPALAVPLISRIFDAIDYTCSDPACYWEARELRRHGCNALLGLALRNPQCLTVVWPALLERVTSILPKQHISTTEAVSLAELLVVVYSHIGNYDQQSELIGKLVAPFAETWRTLISVCNSPASFVTAIGLAAPPESFESDDEASTQRRTTRRQINHLVSLITKLLQRCRPPRDKARLAQNGFIEPSSGAVCCPAAQHVLPHMPLIFQLLRCLSSLDAPDVRALFHADYAGVMKISPVASVELLRGSVERPQSAADRPKSALECMRSHLMHVFETTHTLLAQAFPALDHELLALPRLQEYLAGSVLHELRHLSDHRLRIQVRGMWRYGVWRCPLEQAPSLMHPLLAALFEELVERLDKRWNELSANVGNTDAEEDPEALVAEMLTRLITREAAALLGIVLSSAGPAPLSCSSSAAAAVDDRGEAMEADEAAALPPAPTTVGAWGRAAVASPTLARPLLQLMFKCIGWGDSLAALKATNLAPMVIAALLEDNMLDDAAASQLLYWLLHGVQVQGHFENNYSSLSHAVQAAVLALWPAHPAAVTQVLVQVPEATPDSVEKLRYRLFNHPKVSHSEKMKKEEVKRFIRPLVSCSISQLFQKKVCIRDLLPVGAPPGRDCRPRAQEVVSLAELFGDNA